MTAFRLEGQKGDGEPPFFFFALNVIVYFQTSVQTSLTLSAFEFAKSDFELHKPLYKAIQGMH